MTRSRPRSDSSRRSLGRIATSTNFNGTSLLNSNDTLKFQVGANAGADSQIAVDLSGANVQKVLDSLGATTAAGTAFTIKSGTALTALPTDKLSFTSTVTADGKATGAAVDSSTVTTGKLTGSGEDGAFTSVDDYVSALNSDANFSTNFTATTTRDTNGAATGFTVQARNGGFVAETSPLASDSADGADPAEAVFTGKQGDAAAGLLFDTADHAQAAIVAIDKQIAAVSSARSNLGAIQNRFDHAINVTNVAKENLTAAKSRITDVDMAEEMVKYTRDNILSQAGTSMLAQANQSTQGVLSLLR